MAKKPSIDIEIPGYRIVKQLGRGGMAIVYMAIQESIDREVALKIMLPALVTDESFTERFLREARIAAKLAHPNIVSVFDVGVAGDNHYISMEYHPGSDLKERIKAGLPLKQAIRVMKEISSALDFAHKKGFIHRDIKPENILFSQTGAAILSDFGIARATEPGTHLTATGTIMGTPHYMSPEQASGKKVDGRADLYSMGIVFYQMLLGRVPFEGDSAMSIGIKHIRDPVPPLPKRLEKYQTFLDKLLAKEPEARWQKGEDIVRTLEAIEMGAGVQGGATLQSTMVSSPSGTQVIRTGAHKAPPPKKKKGGGRGAMIGLVLVAIVGAGGYFAMQRMSLAPLEQAAIKQAEESVRLKKEQELALEQQQMLAQQQKELEDRQRKLQEQQLAEKKQAKESARLRKEREQIKQQQQELVRKQQEMARERERQRIAGKKQIEEQKRLAEKRRLEESKRADEKRLADKKTSEQKQLAEKKRLDDLRNKLTTLVNNANGYLNPARLTEGRTGKAYDRYRAARKISPNSRTVKKLPLKIANAYQTLAKSAQAGKKWERAERLANKGLAIYPNHDNLLALLDKVGDEQRAAAPKTEKKKTSRRTFGGF